MKTIARCSSLLFVSGLVIGFGGLAGCESEEVIEVTPRKVNPDAPKVDPNAMPGQGNGLEQQGG
ncbi:MAG: hypothetical protein CMJ23_09265 [Phycisphaerae bacterium]|nr:hypothetical protein [Phycisphaerae bacterium]